MRLGIDPFMPASLSIGRRLFVVLALSAVLPAVITLAMTMQFVRNHTATIQTTRVLVARSEGYDRMARALNELVAAALDLTPASERGWRSRVAAADADLADAIAGAKVEAEAHVLTGDTRRQLLRNIREFDQSRAAIVASILPLRSAMLRGDTADAARWIRGIEAARARASNGMLALRRTVRGNQLNEIRQAAMNARRLSRYAWVLLGTFATAICVIAVVARRSLDHQVLRRARMRDIEELQRRNEALEEAMDGIATFDRQGRYTWLNSNFARIVRYEPDELIGLDIRAALVDVDPGVVKAATEELLANGRTEREVRVRRKDGTVAYVQVVLVYRRGRDCGFVFLKDVTQQKQIEAALRLTEERFGLAMHATRDLFWDWEIATNRVWVNDALHTEMGYPASARPTIEGWVDAMHPADRDRVLATMNAALADGSQSWTEEYRIARFDRSYAYVMDRTYILRDEYGLPYRIAGCLTDITPRREAQEELERLSAQNRLILASAADGIYGVDREGRTTFVNPAAVDLLGWTSEELLGRSLHDVVHFKDERGAPIALDGCELHKTLRFSTSSTTRSVYWKKDGTPLSVEISTEPMCDASGAIVGAVLTFRDITRRVAVDQMKDEFISVVSHELRTPLTSIRGALGLIVGGRAGEVPEKMNRMLEIAVSNTDRLVRLINDILDIERMDSGKITLARRLCHAEELIQEALESVKPLADHAGVRLEQAPSRGVLFADADRLVQTLTNLIGNAIKFSPRDTTVTIAAELMGEDVRFSVTDQGRGIPREKLAAIFERFQQVDASDSRQRGGSGLGLAICRTIVSQHGGEIWAESEPGKGATFYFTLPEKAP